MFRAKDLQTFPQLDTLMGNDEIVTDLSGRYKDFSNSQLYEVWKSARNRLKSNGLANSGYSDPKSTVKDVVSAVEIACARKIFNIRRDGILEKNVLKELERSDYKTICACAQLCEPEINPKEIEDFKRVRDLYRKLRKFVEKFGSSSREYRHDYETTMIKYRESKRRLISHICNYVLHPKRSFGEYTSCKNNKEIKIIRESNRSRILRIKDRMLKALRRKPSLYDSIMECQENLMYQNLQQSKEPEDLSLIRNVLLKVCPHDDHDFLDCPNLKNIKEELKYSFAGHLTQ